MELTAEFKLERETKNTVRYEEIANAPPHHGYGLYPKVGLHG